MKPKGWGRVVFNVFPLSSWSLTSPLTCRRSSILSSIKSYKRLGHQTTGMSLPKCIMLLGIGLMPILQPIRKVAWILHLEMQRILELGSLEMVPPLRKFQSWTSLQAHVRIHNLDVIDCSKHMMQGGKGCLLHFKKYLAIMNNIHPCKGKINFVTFDQSSSQKQHNFSKSIPLT